MTTDTENRTHASTPAHSGVDAVTVAHSRAAAKTPAKTRTSALMIAGLLIAALAAWGCMQLAFADSANDAAERFAVITDGDGNTHRISLSENGAYPITTSLGTNVISVENGEAHMEEADCPGHDCIDQGAISSKGEIIVCLPHKLIVNIEDESDDSTIAIDGMAS